MRARRRTMAAGLAALAIAGTAVAEAGGATALPRGAEPVVLNPADFTTRIDNPYWPMRPGSRWVYRETAPDGTRQRVVVTVTRRTRLIANGVKARVVRDVVTEDGKLVEVTDDWYAQDRAGTIWYLGEATTEYENGKATTTAGSFEAGEDGAQAGVILPAKPEPGLTYRQEYYKGEAEDMFWVVGTGESLSVPLGEFDDVVRVLEFNPLEPRVVVEKRYAPGIGLLVERALSGGKENVELLEIIEPGSPGRRGGCRL
jgi:hypothetical protein